MGLPRRAPAWLGAAVWAAVFAGCASAPVSREGLAREEDLRAASSRLIARGAKDASPSIRAAAARAMGRVQAPGYAGALGGLLEDPDGAVRAEAIFALGQTFIVEGPAADPGRLKAERALAELFDRDPGVLRPAAIEALGKTGGERAQAILIGALSDESPEVRGQAALGLFRRKFLKRIPDYSTGTVSALLRAMKDPDAGVRWRAVYAFSRFPEPRALAGLKAAAEDSGIWARFFAARALGQLKEKAPVEILVRMAKDPDYLVRAEAVRALGQARRGDLLSDDVLRDGSAHVRAAAAAALGEGPDAGLSATLAGFAADESVMARGAALVSRAKLLGEGALPVLLTEKSSSDWRLRAHAYAALGEFPAGARFLKDGLVDPDARAGAVALEALARSTEAFVDAALARILEDPGSSMELRGAAAQAAGERGTYALIEPLIKALRNSRPREFGEVRSDIAEAVKAISKANPQAKQQWIELLGEKYEASPFLGRAPARAAVVLETEKGEIELELFPEDAPIHVASFLAAVSSGVYAGTIWHRVVTGFVIQGADPRGSGWGDCGYFLRDEINARPFERGTLGMPKAGKDTGGCQIFITHVPTPHLDGRYTVFGRVTRGMDVVDRIEPGDKILRARALP